MFVVICRAMLCLAYLNWTCIISFVHSVLHMCDVPCVELFLLFVCFFSIVFRTVRSVRISFDYVASSSSWIRSSSKHISGKMIMSLDIITIIAMLVFRAFIVMSRYLPPVLSKPPVIAMLSL